MTSYLLLLLPLVAPSNILIYQPLLLQSHVQFMAVLADELVNSGHNVTMLVSELNPSIGHRTNLVANFITVPPSPDLKNELATIDLWDTVPTPESQSLVMQAIGRALREQCKHLLTSSEILRIIRESEFDLVIHEVFDMCGLAILASTGNQRKHIIVSSTRSMDTVPLAIGALDPLRDAGLLSDLGSSFGCFSMRRNIQFVKQWLNFNSMQEEYYRKELKALGVIEPLKSIIRTASSIFLNTHPSVDSWSPPARNTFEIGGISVKKAGKLDEEYTSLLSNWSRVAIVSFGTALPSSKMPEAMKKGLRSAMENTKDTLFLWKYEQSDNFSMETSNNIVFRPFLPQNELLGSGRISLFLTHGGQNSLLEAAAAGVPLVVVPMFGDQHRNARGVAENGNGIVISKWKLADSVYMEATFKRMMDDESIRTRTAEIKSEMASPAFIPRDVFVKMVEYAIRSQTTVSHPDRVVDYLLIYDRVEYCIMFMFLSVLAVVVYFLSICISLGKAKQE